MLANSLADPYLKLARAKEHLDFLQEQASIFNKSEPYTITFEDDLERQLYLIRIKLTRDPPENLCVIVGEFFYNLRSALDQSVWALARLKVSEPAKSIQFPILEQPDGRRFERQTADVPREAVSIIEALQPYHRGDAIKDHLLWRLNQMCVIDKHRRIHSRGTSISYPNMALLPHGIVPEGHYSPGEHVISIPLRYKGQQNLKPTAAASIIFGDFPHGVQMGLEGLADINQFVADTVIPKFLRFFQ
jgi:hypothetical protein